MKNRNWTATTATTIAAAAALALILTGCVPNGTKTGAATVSVKASDKACALSTPTAVSGPVTFNISNSGSDVTELEILAEDKLRIVGEKENVGPGTTPTYVAQLEPGTYFVSCKPGMVGSGVGQSKFVVTDSGVKVSANTSDAKQIAQAVTNYISYSKDQAGQLVTATAAFVAAYEAGDFTTSKALYPAARAHYERIEPLAEKFPALDQSIDFRQADLSAGDPWTGWHRIEQDMWPPVGGYTALTAAERATLSAKLVSDTQKLYALLYAPGFSVSLGDISNGAVGLMDEVATGKVTGEEEIWSHTDLSDFQANIEGANVAFENVKAIASAKSSAGKALVTQISTDFATLSKTLAQYGSISAGYVSYTSLTPAQVKELSDQVAALSEPLSKLTAVILK